MPPCFHHSHYTNHPSFLGNLNPVEFVFKKGVLCSEHLLLSDTELQTRSGAVFAAWLPSVPTLSSEEVDFAPLLSQAIAAQEEEQEDHEPDDDLDGIDEECPPPYPIIEQPPAQPPPPNKRPRPTDLADEGPPERKKLSGSHLRRKNRRATEIPESGHTPRPSSVQQHVRPALYIPAPFIDAMALPTTSCGYLAKTEGNAERNGRKKRRTLKEMISLGFQLVVWDGITPRPLVDSCGRIFAVLAGQPVLNGYGLAVARAFNLMKSLGSAAQFPAAMLKHRRGLFAAINVGLTLGKGQPAPTWLDGGDHTAVVEKLIANEDVQRMATFASYAFALWAPRLHNHYVENNAKLRTHCPNLRRLFPLSVFSCAAFNFATNVWSFKHRDVCNLPYGWCAIQSMGNFDATKGGHLILWDLKMVVEFPAGALILVPSATIAHSNIPVQDGDERVSFTQFTAGNLFRFTDNNGRTDKKFSEEDPEGYSRALEQRGSRWEKGLEMFSTVDEMFVKDS
ncbi:hypothetical protein R3P38DRAFT_2513428 [Favolaschia claudopus]|uniref:Uncharacterized protein n=1 Tax=Favolaschia claudopus TaxID=2862362 RepID=A0AAW0CQA7_9AGAR